MQRLRVDGLEVRVHHAGSGDPLLFLHSGFGDAGRTPFVALLEERFEVLAPELPGFGGSEAPRWHRVEDAVYFLRCLLDQCGWTAGGVVGSSLGGWLAAELAVWFPERVEQLVLFDPVGIKVEGAPIADVFMVSRNEMISQMFHHLPSDLEAALGDALEASDGDLLLHFSKALEATARIGWNPYFHDPLLAPRLGSCSVPLTVAWGEADGVTLREYAQAFAASVRGGRFVVVPESGHLPTVESPGAASTVVFEALAPAPA